MTTSPMPYPDADSLPTDLREMLAERGNVNVYRMVTHSAGLAPCFLTMAADMFVKNSMPPAWRELAILRVGFRYRAAYEVHHHINIGRAVGLSEAGMTAAESGSVDGLDDGQALLVHLTDLLLDNHTLTDAEREDALTILRVEQLADFVLTVGFYQLVCNFLNTFGVTIEEA
jgi:4-carboxymuconolactone decarboxylase